MYLFLFRLGISFIADGADEICRSSKSIASSSTYNLYCFRMYSNSGANNLTFSKFEFVAGGIENGHCLQNCIFLEMQK